jgi:hypothetical protein
VLYDYQKRDITVLVIEKKNGSMLRISLKPIEFKNDFGSKSTFL